MAITQSDHSTPRKRLRLWPGVVAVVLLWLARFGLKMGIDVRAYVIVNLDVKRAACVGCGMCAHVCPRGVLKLANKADRFKGGRPIRVYAVDL